jgi:hypothetical protein
MNRHVYHGRMKLRRIATLAALALLTVAAYAQWRNPANDVPAYNAAPPRAALPPILSGSQLTGEDFQRPFQARTYQMAAKIPAVLHQMPCYCHCDRALGHNSLHSCFESHHGAECSTCLKEAVFAYRQTKLGKTPTQIRAAVERGEWMNVDLDSIN